MGILSDLKIRSDCKKTGRMAEYQEYKQHLEIYKKDIERFEKYIEEFTQKFEDVKRRFPQDSTEYKNAQSDLYRWIYTLDAVKLKINFCRPNSSEDIQYRELQCNEFSEKLKQVLSTNFDLRFHGTSIYFAEQIIKSGSISSSADRYDGYIKSTDAIGEISVSDRETLKRTLDFFSDMYSFQGCLPAGCIFAVLPRDEEDATYGPNLMHSINFREHPEQLFGIFTTPENIEKVTSWLNKYGLNSKVYTFEEFLKVVKLKSDKIDEQLRFSQSIENPKLTTVPTESSAQEDRKSEQGDIEI